MKTFKHKTLRSYIGAKCKQEGGKSQAKVHDALQIANLIADDLFENFLDYNGTSDIFALSKMDVESADNLFLKTGAKRYLARMKKGKKK